jgi:hypothetical protein
MGILATSIASGQACSVLGKDKADFFFDKVGQTRYISC